MSPKMFKTTENSTINSKNLRELLIVFSSFLLLILLKKKIWGYIRLYIKALPLPGPLNLPLIGAAYLFFHNTLDKFKLFERLYREYPKLFKLWLGPVLTVVITDPTYIEKILTSPLCIEKGEFYEIAQEIFGPGIFTAPRKIWKVHRKATATSFNKNILDTYVKTMAANSDYFVELIKEFKDKKNIDWVTMSKRYSLDTACKTLLGADLDVMHSGTRIIDLADCVENLALLGMIRILQVWHQIPLYYQFSKTKTEFDRYNEIFNSITSSIVKKRLQDFHEYQYGVLPDENARKLDLLELMLQSSTFTEKTLTYEVNTFLVAATDTTGSTICSILMLLGMSPEIQEKVHQEILDTIGETKAIEATDLPNLKYLEAVIKETLRLFPPVVFFSRKSYRDLDLGEITVPKEATYTIIPSLIHRDPKYWKDPLKFDPDRFLGDQQSKIQLCSYLAFSYGPRNCIGGQYAMHTLKTLIATVIRNLRVFTSYKSVEEMEIYFQPVLCFKKGVNIQYELRTP